MKAILQVASYVLLLCCRGAVLADPIPTEEIVFALENVVVDTEFAALASYQGDLSGTLAYSSTISPTGWVGTLSGSYAGHLLNVSYTGDTTDLSSISWTGTGIWGKEAWNSSGSATYIDPPLSAIVDIENMQVGLSASGNILAGSATLAVVKDLDDQTLIVSASASALDIPILGSALEKKLSLELSQVDWTYASRETYSVLFGSAAHTDVVNYGRLTRQPSGSFTNEMSMIPIPAAPEYKLKIFTQIGWSDPGRTKCYRGSDPHRIAVEEIVPTPAGGLIELSGDAQPCHVQAMSRSTEAGGEAFGINRAEAEFDDGTVTIVPGLALDSLFEDGQESLDLLMRFRASVTTDTHDDPNVFRQAVAITHLTASVDSVLALGSHSIIADLSGVTCRNGGVLEGLPCDGGIVDFAIPFSINPSTGDIFADVLMRAEAGSASASGAGVFGEADIALWLVDVALTDGTPLSSLGVQTICHARIPEPPTLTLTGFALIGVICLLDRLGYRRHGCENIR